MPNPDFRWVLGGGEVCGGVVRGKRFTQRRKGGHAKDAKKKGERRGGLMAVDDAVDVIF